MKTSWGISGLRSVKCSQQHSRKTLRPKFPLTFLCVWNYFLYMSFLKNRAKRKQINFADSAKFILSPPIFCEGCVPCDFIR